MAAPGLPKNQTGAVLLAFALLLLVGTSYLLVQKLNANLILVHNQEKTRNALREAKQALIGYAATYPDNVNSDVGPGYLPCPDLNNNGSNASSCSSAGGTTIGRFPYARLETRKLTDAYGQTLWYALSDNFRNNPRLEPLNSETQGDLTVDGQTDIVAVIIAPGPALPNQDRDPSETVIANEIANYLESDNADFDNDFVSHATGDFNDQLIYITRQELMEAVEKRVLGEVAQIMRTYNSTYGAYPWLTPFADPKAEFFNLHGTHNGSDNSSTLDDSTVDFTTWDIQPGDLVINVTDGSIANVSSVSANSLTLTNQSFGTDNDFDDNDKYVVVKNSWSANLLKSTTSTGSTGLTLVDSSSDFQELGIAAGEVVDIIVSSNVDSSGVIESVDSSTQLTLKSLSGGTITSLSSGIDYIIRSNVGKVTAVTSDGLSLTDTNKNFSTMGIQVGDEIIDLTDGSHGKVTAVTSTSLTVDTLVSGTNNQFAINDFYILPRFNTDGSTRRGLLSLAIPGKSFATAFNFDWNLTQANGATINTTTQATSAYPAYVTDLQAKIETSTGTTGTLSITADDGECTWINSSIAYCNGSYEDPNFPVFGTVTSGVNTSILNDSSADFVTTAIKRGDIVENYDDEIATGISGTATSGSSGSTLEDTSKDFSALGVIPYYYLLHKTSGTTGRALITGIENNNTLTIMDFNGQPSVSFSPGDSYTIYTPQRVVVTGVNSSTQLTTSRLTAAAPDFDYNAGGACACLPEFYQVKIATGRLAGTATGGSGGTLLEDTTADFSDIAVSDIVENTTDSSFGIITAVTATTLTATLFDSGGTVTSFDSGDSYVIYYNHDVNTRVYDIKTRISGTSYVDPSPASEERQMDICSGYDSTCSGTPSDVAVTGYDSTPTVTIHDYAYDGTTEVGHAEAVIPASGSTGSVRIAGIAYAPEQSTSEFPDWFINNHWHQLVYMAYAAGNAPGAATPCTAGTDCLTLTGAGSPDDDKQAIVISSGDELGSQNRANAVISDYYEGDNNNADDVLQQGTITDTFNDQARVIK